jgi:hypothetical protein
MTTQIKAEITRLIEIVRFTVGKEERAACCEIVKLQKKLQEQSDNGKL